MPSEFDTDSPSALFQHCGRVYAEMYRNSFRSQADGVTDMVVYEGMLVRLMTKSCGLPVPYYTTIRKRLMDMGCIRQLRRGGGTSPSQWELIREPTADLWDVVVEATAPPTVDLDAQYLQMFADLGRRMYRLEKLFGIEDIPAPKEGT